MSQDYPLSTEDRLFVRLVHAVKTGQKITFLLGSGLTCPGDDQGELGVPGAVDMVKRVRKSFTSPEEANLFDEAIATSATGKQYQAAMQFMIDCRGQTSLNTFIRNAVLEARTQETDKRLNDDEIERDWDGWHLRPAVTALGKLVREHENVFNRPILTSNFDPLIEIGIRRAGRGAMTINLPNDGSFSGLIVNDNTAQVVHMHGFWRQGDTLHTPDQLVRERPLLAGNLRKLLQETTLVVLGYGGWDDVFTRSLMKAIAEQSDLIDVLWTFYTKDLAELKQRHGPLLESFKALPGQRVVAYSGVDCHHFLPKLQRHLAPAVLVKVASDDTGSLPAISVTIKQVNPLSRPPTTVAWVGREDELGLLLRSTSQVIALNGLGGFGKSSLAAQYVIERESRRDVSHSYWCDCREQGNTVQTHLVNMLELVSQGEITAATLQQVPSEEVIELFFEHLGDHRALFVFDNVDHYVDLETQNTIGTLHSLLEKALTVTHRSQFILTSRPKLNYGSPQFLSLHVSGLSEQNALDLFRVRGAAWDPVRRTDQLATVLRLTQGSALHLNLIATQVAKQRTTLDNLLSRIEKGAAPEAEGTILAEIWSTLKIEQQNVLRYLAELPHPETEQRVASCLSNILHPNRFNKAVKAIKSLNLVVLKPVENGGETMELHPLVRTFIRKRFGKEEQATIVENIIGFLDRMIGRFRGAVVAGPASILENWTSKIELCIENGRPGLAVNTLYEIYGNLRMRGYTEEFLRLAELVIRSYKATNDAKELKNFDAIYEDFVSTLNELGRYAEADVWIEKLAQTVEGKSARYILLCEVRAHAFWLRHDFPAAIRWASEGVDLKTASQMDTDFDCSHQLALARRDAGNTDDALRFFLAGEKLEAVLSRNHFEKSRGGAYYGNIGRCLQLQGRLDDALICLRKSARLLENEEGRTLLMNRGWSAQWIGEALEGTHNFDLSFTAFRSAYSKWKPVSPGRAREAQEAANKLSDRVKDPTLAIAGDWEVEQMYLSWLHSGKP